MADQTKLQTGVVERGSTMAKDRHIDFARKGVDVANRTIEMVASGIKIDRDGEIILPASMRKSIQAYLASNAPVLGLHMHRSDDGRPTQIGWSMEGAVKREIVTLAIRLALTTVAEEWWLLASDPHGKGVAGSIGFIPQRWVYGSVADLVAEFPEIAETVRDAKLKGEDKLRVYTEIELLEFSLVPVPSYRQALQVLAAKAAGEDEQAAEKALDHLAELLAGRVADTLAERTKAMLDGAVTLEAVPDPSAGKLNIILDGIAEIRELLTLDTLSPETPGGVSAGGSPEGERAAGPRKTPTQPRHGESPQQAAKRGGAAKALLDACQKQ